MSEAHEFDYQAAIDRLTGDFSPVRPLWPVGLKLLCWVSFVVVFAILAARLTGTSLADAARGADVWSGAIFSLLSLTAGWWVIRSLVPGREASLCETTVVVVSFALAALIIPFVPSSSFRLMADPAGDLSSAWRWIGLAILPWLVLFWTARRGVPVRPGRTGALMGAAAAAVALAADALLLGGSAAASATAVALFGTIVIGWSIVTCRVWLNPARWWQRDLRARDLNPHAAASFDIQWLMPLGLAASVLVMIFSIHTNFTSVSDFDAAIANYDRSLYDFHPNVPSATIDTVLTAYVEGGMPAYMWDFGPQGFKLIGGRLERTAAGTPITYTWFRGSHNGIMCLLRQVEAFRPPDKIHQEHNHMLFYRYRGFSVCLINVGGYGNFISVIAAPMPMKDFVSLVTTATR